jgi:hypothetical protein
LHHLLHGAKSVVDARTFDNVQRQAGDRLLKLQHVAHDLVGEAPGFGARGSTVLGGEMAAVHAP